MEGRRRARSLWGASLVAALLIGSAPAAAAVPGPSLPLDQISTLESCRFDPAAARCPQQHRPAAVGPDGSLFLLAGNRVLRRDPQGRTSTVAGSGRKDLGCRDGAPAARACLEPSAVAIGSDGAVFVADVSRRRVLRIAPSGSFTVVAAGLGIPYALASDRARGVFVGTLEGRVFRATAGGSVRHVAGRPRCSRTLPEQFRPSTLGDGGPASAACLFSVSALAFTGGVLYVADSGDNRLRAVTADGRISTVAGNGLAPIDALTACPAAPLGAAGCLGAPAALAVGPSGRLYIAANATDGEGTNTFSFGTVYRFEPVTGVLTQITARHPVARASKDDPPCLGEDLPPALACHREVTGLVIDGQERVLFSESSFQRGIHRLRAITFGG